MQEIPLPAIRWKYGSPTADAVIRSIESQLAVAFPLDYRALLAEHDGARPKPNALDLPGQREIILERLLRVNSDAGENVLSATDVVRRRSAANLVPFASDPFGNLFCFQFAGKSSTAVVFWEHENGRVSTICKTLSELLGLLHTPSY